MRNVLSFVLMLAPLLNLAQSKQILISNGNVVDVRTGKITKDASVLIRDGIIQEVFTSKKMKLSPETEIIDGTSKFIIPGMTDAHIHFFQSGSLYTRPDAFNFTHKVPYQKERDFAFNNTGDFMRRYLRMGVTTVVDVGGPVSNFKVRDSIAAKTISPTVLVTGPLFSMVSSKPLDNGEPPIIKTTTIEQADSLLDKMLPMKPDFIKIWYIVAPGLPAEKTFPIVQHIAKRTHEAKLKLAVHATELKTASLAVDAGADILVHSVDDEIVSEEFIKKLVKRNVSYIPTLIVMRGYRSTMNGNLSNHSNDLNFANPFAYSSLSAPEHMEKNDLPLNFQRFRGNNLPTLTSGDSIRALNLKKLYRAGVNVVAGTDAGNVGTMHASSFVIELEAMKEAGLSNLDILKTATMNSASCFSQNSGIIEKGRNADMVILSKNPLESISNITTAQYIIKHGQVMRSDSIIRETPEMLIQRQVNAYNAKDLEAFLSTYSDEIELFNFPDTPIGKGKDAMRKIYAPIFTKDTYLHCEVVNRIVLNNTIIDQERVKFNDNVINAIAIYKVNDGKIVSVTFQN
jgi:imidazolonepropionase-like amidohydrolase